MLTAQYWNNFSIRLTRCKAFFSPLDTAPCAETPYLVAKWHYIFWHKLHFANKIVYFKKQLKQNVQFLHAVALLSIYATKKIQRKSTFFNDYKSVENKAIQGTSIGS